LLLASEGRFSFSQLLETISVEFRRGYNTGQRIEISEGIIYYEAAAKKTTLDVAAPIRQWMQVRKNEILIYYAKEKCAFRIFSKNPLSMEFFEAFLSVMKDDYGLSEFGYKMESYEVRGGKLASNWVPPLAMSKILGPISIEFQDNRIAQIDVKRPDGKTLSKLAFSNHVQFGSIYFPLEIRITRYLPAEVITESIQYKNPRFNIPLPKEIVNLEIPPDIPVKEFEW